MAKITRRQLKQIIQEEIQNTVIDEGFVDTFKMLGGDLKKWYKSAEQRGDVSASERASDKVVQATIRSLEDNLNKLRSKYGMEGEKGTEAIRQRMGELKVQIATLGKKDEAADDVIDAIADASDGDLELPNVIQVAKDLRAKVDALETIEDAEKAEEEKAAAAVKGNPEDYAEIIIKALNQYTSGRLGRDKNVPFLKGSGPGTDEKFLTTLRNRLKQVAEGKVEISRKDLKEVLSLLTENGL
jgi:hypothetical protein